MTKGATRVPKVGDVVLCADEQMSRDYWKLAVVLKLIHSEDDEVRTVLVRNSKLNEVQKSVNHLIPLEICTVEDPNPTKADVEVKVPEKRERRSTRKDVDYCENSKKRNPST